VDSGSKADAAKDTTVEVATAPSDASDDDSASPVDAGSDRISVVVNVDAAIEAPADVALDMDTAIDSAMPGNDVASDTDALTD
jgi:hypothetical protein